MNIVTTDCAFTAFAFTLASSDYSKAKTYTDWYLCLWWFVSLLQCAQCFMSPQPSLTLSFSVCIISIVRLIVLSRLEAYDVTCEFLDYFHVNEHDLINTTQGTT